MSTPMPLCPCAAAIHLTPEVGVGVGVGVGVRSLRSRERGVCFEGNELLILNFCLYTASI
jgi:hypothetical protein